MASMKMKAKSAPLKAGRVKPKGKKAAAHSAVLALTRVVRGLIDAQRANTDRLNEIHAVVQGLRGHDYFDRSDLDRAMDETKR